MWNTLRKAVISHKINEIKGDLQRAGESLEKLLVQPDLLDRLDGETAWGLIHGLDASFSVLDKTIRGVLGANAQRDGEVTRTMRDVQAAIATLQTALASLGPLVESQYGVPSKAAKWKIQGPFD